MKKSMMSLAMLCFVISVTCQSKINNQLFNFDFEMIEHEKPIGWENFGTPNYKVSIDSIQVKSGSHSANIEFVEGAPNFKAYAFTLPENYDGSKIKLSGYIKTENVTDGYAGLWMRIDPSVAFDNMNGRGVTGTTDWTYHEITLDMSPEVTEKIVVGGLLVGKGKMWIDELKVTIDGNDIKSLPPHKKKALPATLDKEFDNGSGIEIQKPEPKQIENLKILGLVWGFIKYYHPNIAKGEYNMDYELFRILPSVMNSKESKIRDEILFQWIKKFGSFQEGHYSAVKAEDVKLEPDLEWINNTGFLPELADLLNKVKNASRPTEHYYFRFIPGVGNPEFKNENSYSTMKFPDTGFRLLSLFRYWNMIQYFFPYKNLMEGDWKRELVNYIPLLISTKSETEYTLCMLELIEKIHDSHASIWGANPVLKKYFGDFYAPVEITFVENKALVTGYYNEKTSKDIGLDKGEVITKINHKSLEEIISSSLKYYPASNYPTQLRNLASNIFRSNDSILYVECLKEGKKKDILLKLYPIDKIRITSKFQVKDTSFRMIQKDVAYINHGSLKRAHLPIIWDKIKDTKGLIIDDRNYPSDFPIYDLSNYLMPNPTPFVKFSETSFEFPGRFIFNNVLKAGTDNPNSYKGKVVILVNENTQSSAEFHAMAYRVHPGAKVIGSTTAGADGNVSQIFLPGGIQTMITGIGVFYPDGKETQRIGIVPDIYLKPTILGIKEGKDEILDKAIDLINSNN